MTDYPRGGSVTQTRAWLDSKGLTDVLEGWEADAVIGLSEDQIMDLVSDPSRKKLRTILRTARQTSACTSDFPFGGNPEQTKTWLENKGFHGILPEWPADSILFLSASEIKDEVPGVDAEKLIGFINTARQALGATGFGAPPGPMAGEPPRFARVIEFMRRHERPVCYGYPYELPMSLEFLFRSGNNTENTILVRSCYEDIVAIVDRAVHATLPGSGVIFTGAQGNSKTWCSLYVVWHFVQQGTRCIVYELASASVVYIIKPNGVTEKHSGRADSARFDQLEDKRTVHIFDAKAHSDHEPADSPAFLIEFSSRNQRSYAQTQRKPDMMMCCIPSYDVNELLRFCGRFNVPEEEVRRRCLEIGPSIRYVLVNEYAKSKAHTYSMAKTVKPDQLDAYIRDTHAATGSREAISACLLLVRVDESRFEDRLLAYNEENAIWEFASRTICEMVMDNAGSTAKSFIQNFITTVNRDGITKLKGVAGNFLELIVDDFLIDGSFQAARKLSDLPNLGVIPLKRLSLWQTPRVLKAGLATTIVEALRSCTDLDALFCFCKSFTAVDYSALGFRVVFQITTALTHPVQLEAMRTICLYVKKTYPLNPKVLLVFVVPAEVVSTAATGDWRRTQSFAFEVEEVDARGVHTIRKASRKFDQLPKEAQEDLDILEQWVVCYTPK